MSGSKRKSCNGSLQITNASSGLKSAGISDAISNCWKFIMFSSGEGVKVGATLVGTDVDVIVRALVGISMVSVVLIGFFVLVSAAEQDERSRRMTEISTRVVRSVTMISLHTFKRLLMEMFILDITRLSNIASG
jgi:hypothetical protein